MKSFQTYTQMLLTPSHYCDAFNKIEPGHFIAARGNTLQIRKGTNLKSEPVSPVCDKTSLLQWCDAMFPELATGYTPQGLPMSSRLLSPRHQP